MTVNDVIIPLSVLVFVMLFMTWLHIKIEEKWPNSLFVQRLSWVVPLTVIIFPLYLASLFFN